MLDNPQQSAAETPSPSRWDFRFSTASSSTTATVSTLLPQYSPVADDDWDSDVLARNNSNAASTVFPPRYSAIHPVTLTPPPTGSSDDAEAGVQLSGFRYFYPLKSTKPWATLLLHSHDAVPGNMRTLQGQPKVPQIWGCQPITGSLELEIDSPMTIQRINIIIKGKITASALDDGSYKFLDYQLNLWDASDGGLPGHNRKDIDGNLTGSHSFPFCVPFPNDLDTCLNPNSPSDNPYALPVIKKFGLPSPTNPNLSSKGEEQRTSFFTSPSPSPLAFSKRLIGRGSGTQRPRKQYIPSYPVRITHALPISVASSIPQTFAENRINASVKYQFSVQLVYGRFKTDSRITTSIRYIPASQPHPSSQKRVQAYAAGTLIPGPMSDPDGWFDLPTVSVDGIFQSVLHSQQSKIDFKCYLAQPLSYTRGTVIPCFLTLSSADSEALDSLSNPGIPNVKLIRHLRHFSVADYQGRARSSVVLSPSSTLPTSQPPGSSLLCKTVHHEVATATWWVPPKDVQQETHIRHLEGEIHLNPDLHPSCSSHVFHVEYFVQMFSLQSAKFEQTHPSHSSSEGERALGPTVMASWPVEITTLCRLNEPLPKSFTEPSDRSMRQIPCESVDPETEAARYLASYGFL